MGGQRAFRAVSVVGHQNLATLWVGKSFRASRYLPFESKSRAVFMGLGGDGVGVVWSGIVGWSGCAGAVWSGAGGCEVSGVGVAGGFGRGGTVVVRVGRGSMVSVFDEGMVDVGTDEVGAVPGVSWLSVCALVVCTSFGACRVLVSVEICSERMWIIPSLSFRAVLS